VGTPTGVALTGAEVGTPTGVALTGARVGTPTGVLTGAEVGTPTGTLTGAAVGTPTGVLTGALLGVTDGWVLQPGIDVQSGPTQPQVVVCSQLADAPITAHVAGLLQAHPVPTHIPVPDELEQPLSSVLEQLQSAP